MTIQNDNYEKLFNEFTELKNQINKNDEQLAYAISQLMEIILENQEQSSPYKKLAKWQNEAMQQIKKDIADSMYGTNTKKNTKLQKQEERIHYNMDKIIGIIEGVKKNTEERKTLENPLYPKSIFSRFDPRYLLKRHEHGARNSISLLVAGVGLVVFSRGVWDASGELLSTQGSLIIGAVIIALTAWLERRKIFALFGQD